MKTGKRLIAGIASTTLIASALVASSALAANNLPDPPSADIAAVATLTKDVNIQTVSPGQTFTYEITVGCSSLVSGCAGAVLFDTIPAPFELVSVVVGGGTNTGDVVISGNSFTVTWTSDLGDGTYGIHEGSTGVVQVTVLLPADVSYDYNGIEVVNDASIEGTNFIDVTDSVGVTPNIPLVLGTTATKTITPSTVLVTTPRPTMSAQLTGSNDSNATVDSLSITDPTDPTADPNPFEYLGFTGFGPVTPPAGTDTTTYEVYIPDAWVPVPGGDLTTAGIDPALVRGTRVTFTGAIPPGATGSVDLELQLTDEGANLPNGAVVGNDVQSEVSLDSQTADDTAEAGLTIQQNTITVEIDKSFSPPVVVVGESSNVTLHASNQSPFAIQELIISEPSSGSFPPDYTFGGFTAGIVWPCGAISGTVTLQPGGEEIAFADGAIPDLGGIDPATVTSFSVVFEGAICPGAEVTINFDVDTDPNMTPDTPYSTVNNEAQVVGNNDGATGSAVGDDDLYIFDEEINTYVSKSQRPAEILGVPGQSVTVGLTGGLTERPTSPPADSGPIENFPPSTGSASEVILQDPNAVMPPTVEDSWWNSFELTRITRTTVPACTTLKIEYYDTVSSSWQPLAGPIDGGDSGAIYSSPGNIDPAISDVAGGVRFIYTPSVGCPDIPPGTDFEANFNAVLRDPNNGLYTSPAWDATDGGTLSNCSVATGSSDTVGVDDATSAPSCADVEIVPTDPGVYNLIDKVFGTSVSGCDSNEPKCVIARSGDKIPSTLYWSTGGYSNLTTVEITDISNPTGTPIADSIYDAFNLTQINTITPATDPYISYDRVTNVDLWNSTAWVKATNSPCESGGCDGQMPAIALTAAEQLSTLSVRITFAESDTNRVGTDPNAPAVGTGVARSLNNNRQITLVWQVRDYKRSDGTAVTADEIYNLAGEDGTVRNTVNVTGYPETGGTISDDSYDDVVIWNPPITTTTTKRWDGGPLSVPEDTGGLYPTSRITVTTRNTTPGKVDNMFITDPSPNAVAPNLGVFDAFTLTNIAAITVPSGTVNATVTLFCPGGSNWVGTRVQALALTSTTMPCDVSGISVDFDGRVAFNSTEITGNGIAAGASGVLVFDVTLRAFWRSNPTLQVTSDSWTSILNGNQAQGIVSDVTPVDPTDPSTCPPLGEDRHACADADASIDLVAASFGVSASKTIAPAYQYEGDFSNVTVTIGGQTSGSVRTGELTLQDADSTFWNAFNFVGVPTSFTFPAPAVAVRACYLSGGSFSDANIATDVATQAANNNLPPSTPLAYDFANASTTGAPLNGWVAPGAIGGTWTCQTTFGAWATAATFLNNAATANPSGIHGVQFSFIAGGNPFIGWAPWENPAHPNVTVPFLVQRREYFRSSPTTPVQSTRADQSIPPGETVLGTYVNTSTAYAESVNVSLTGNTRTSAVAAADASYFYRHLPVKIDVTKGPNGNQTPGKVFEYTLTFKNSGQLPLVSPVFSDRLPVFATGPHAGQTQLIFDPDPTPGTVPWSFSLSGADPNPATPNLPVNVPAVAAGTYATATPAGITVTDDLGVDIDPSQPPPAEIFFHMPATAVLEPGQTYTIRIWMMLAPGVTPADSLQNWAVMDIGDTPIDTDANGNVTGCTVTFEPDPVSVIPGVGKCKDDAVVSPLNVPALSTLKFVRADNPPSTQGLGPAIPDWVNASGAPLGSCTPSLLDPTGDFYRYPCQPVTIPGDTATWRVKITNVGTLPIREVTAIDSLPQVGDTGVIIAVGRGTQWVPTLTGPPTLDAATLGTGATLTTYVSTSFVTCPTGGASLNNCQPTAWAAATATTDWSTVQSLKFVITFPPGSLFTPAESLYLDLQTQTWPGALAQQNYPLAWNSIADSGVAVNPLNNSDVAVPSTEGRMVGISYPTGPIQVEKVTSDVYAQAHQNDTFVVDVQCTLGGEVVYTGSVTLQPTSWDDGTNSGSTGRGPTTISGLPWGAKCTITEGMFGQTSTAITNETVTVGLPGDPLAVTTVDNSFGPSSVMLSKRAPTTGATYPLDQDGNPIPYGPFSFTIVCFDETGTGTPVYGPQTETLAAGNAWAVPLLPDGGQCVITENDNLGAVTSWLVNSDPPIPGGLPEGPLNPALGYGPMVWQTVSTAPPSIRVYLPTSQTTPISIIATNTFHSGSLELAKVVDEAVADSFGAGPFTFVVDCVADINGDGIAEQVWLDTATVGPNETITIGRIALGATCRVTEIGGGFQTEIVYTPASLDDGGISATVTIDTAGQVVQVSVENVYEWGMIAVQKTIEGNGAALWGAGPFEVTLTCTYDDGTGAVLLEIPGGATRLLTADGTIPYPWVDGGDNQLAPIPYYAEFYPLLVGADCVLTETNAGGASLPAIFDPVHPNDPTSSDIITIDDMTLNGWTLTTLSVTNTFLLGQFRVLKEVSGPAAADHLGDTFLVDADCTWNGAQIEVPDPVDSLVTRVTIPRTTLTRLGVSAEGWPIEDGQQLIFDQLPIGAECDIYEADNGGASQVQWAGPTGSVLPNDPTHAHVTVVATPGVAPSDGDVLTFTVDNSFGTGSLRVNKVMAGDGASLWGAGPFEVTLACTKDGAVVEIPQGATRSLSAAEGFTTSYGPFLPGTVCTLTETDAGGATTTAITNPDGSVHTQIVIVQDEELALTATNTFEVGEIEVTKTVSGVMLSGQADATYRVTLACTWNGAAITIPGGAVRDLRVDAPARFTNLPVGAACTVTETATGGAVTVTYSPADPSNPNRALVTVGGLTAATVTINNGFADVPPPTPPTPPPPTPTPTPPTPIPTPPTPTPTPPAPTTPNHLAPTGIDGAQAMALLLVAALFITTGALAMLIIRQRHLPKHLQ